MGPPFGLLGSKLQEETHPKGPRTQIIGSLDRGYRGTV